LGSARSSCSFLPAGAGQAVAWLGCGRPGPANHAERSQPPG